MSQVVSTISDYRLWKHNHGESVVAVFTMGALHNGHTELINSARKYLSEKLFGKGKIVVSIFVNPTQFNSQEDLANYPRTFEDDQILCTKAGVDLIFAPSVKEVYPDGETLITLTHHKIGEDLEGLSRPNHFAGMLTVVNKLLNITNPVAAFFGEKDFQQFVLVNQMVTDLNMPIEIVSVETVRDEDGLALSSRNRKLSPKARDLAKQIPASLNLINHSIDEGHDLPVAIKMAREYLANFPEIEIDYLELRNNQLHQPKEKDSIRALIAVYIEGTRLIDNLKVKD